MSVAIQKSLFQSVDILVHRYQVKIEADLKASHLLGTRGKGKQIYLYKADYDSPVLLEIGRLREQTFRHTGLGTGQFYDLDDFDYRYEHLVLWDDVEKIIIGAYRLMPCATAINGNQHAASGHALYTQSIYQYSDSFMEDYFEETVEMGRIFIRRSHWGGRSLDYLWYGMAQYFALHPELRYFVCALSIPAYFPPYARQIMVDFYSRQFPDDKQLAKPLYPYHQRTNTRDFCRHLTALETDAQRYAYLQRHLANMGLEFPMLYKNTEIFHRDGVRFIAFGLDRGFSNAFDGLMLADVTRIRETVLTRYHQI